MSSPSFLTEGLEEDTRRHIHREKSISVPGNLFSKKALFHPSIVMDERGCGIARGKLMRFFKVLEDFFKG